MTVLLISLYVLQTFIGAVFWRKYTTDSAKFCFWTSFFIIPNLIAVIVWAFIFTHHGIMYLWDRLMEVIDYLAGKKN